MPIAMDAWLSAQCRQGREPFGDNSRYWIGPEPPESYAEEEMAITIVIMPITMDHEGGNLFRVEIRGTLRKAELDRYQTELAVHMARLGPVKLLFILEAFAGWDATDSWRDLSFYITHGDTIERIAIVGEERWRDETLMFAGADLRKAPVQFFPEDAMSEARAWLSA